MAVSKADVVKALAKASVGGIYLCAYDKNLKTLCRGDFGGGMVPAFVAEPYGYVTVDGQIDIDAFMKELGL